MALFTKILECIIGVLFMCGAFFATAIRPGLAFSRGPSYRISKVGRIIIFLAGMAVFIDGLEQLLGRSGGLDFGWRGATSFAAVVLLVVFVNSKLVRGYAGRMPTSRPTVAINFANGLPSAMVAVRIAFFVIVAVMVVFGVGPVANSTAKAGIITCVLALFVVAFANGALEQHYVKTGRANKVAVPAEKQDR